MQHVPLLDSPVWMTRNDCNNNCNNVSSPRNCNYERTDISDRQVQSNLNSTQDKTPKHSASRQESGWLCNRKISCCFSFKTIQQLRYQVFCCLTILNAQQLRQWMPISHFSWLSSYYPQEPNKFLTTLSSWLMYWFQREQCLLHIILKTLSIEQTNLPSFPLRLKQ
jgi:hypothetical protein